MQIVQNQDPKEIKDSFGSILMKSKLSKRFIIC